MRRTLVRALAAVLPAVAFALIPTAIALAANVPVITGLVPAAGVSAGGDSIVINGTGFAGLSGASAVTFGGVDAPRYTIDSDTQITAVTPAGAAGTARVAVMGAGGTSVDTAADDFTFMDRYDQGNPRITYSGTWETFSKTTAWYGAYKRASASGASVTVTFVGTRLDWIAMKGTTAGLADVYLDGVFKTTVDLASSVAVYRQRVWSTGAVSNGVHSVRVARNSSSPTGKYVTIDAVDIVGTLMQTGKIEQTDARLVYAGAWNTVSSASASGGSYKRASTSAASVTIPFEGQRLDLYATTSAGQGIADVSVDGGDAVPVDLHSATTLYRQKVFSTGTLSSSYHTVKVSWSGGNQTGRYINIDSLEIVGGLTAKTRMEQTSLKLIWTGAWSTVTSSSDSGSSLRSVDASGASVSIRFRGVSISLIAMKAAGRGLAKVTLDGTISSYVDLYSATTLYKQTVWSSGFVSPGEHLVTVEWTGTKRAAAHGTSIDLDAVDVRGELTRAVDRPIIIAWQPSHQSDTGSNGWLEYPVCGDIVDHAMADTTGFIQVKAWETGMGLWGTNNGGGTNRPAFDSELKQAHAANAEVFISIHVDASGANTVMGMCFTSDSVSYRVADALAKTLSANLGWGQRSTKLRDLYSLDPVRNGAKIRVLLEIGDNVVNRAMFEDPTNREKIGALLAKTVDSVLAGAGF
jgi:IPT/TIG domain/N-acetylmuramoyl-L-alanine amidase